MRLTLTSAHSIGENHGIWLRKRGVTADLEEAHQEIQRQVYRRVWQAVIRIVETLDFTVDEVGPQEDTESGETKDHDETGASANGDDAADAGVSDMSGLRFQASGMTGREKPVSMQDVDIFHNLVDFTKILLEKVAPRYFEDSCYIFCDTMVKQSSRNPLFSGFFKLLTAAMDSARRGHFFRGLSPELLERTHYSSATSRAIFGGAGPDAMDVEPAATVQDDAQRCFIIMSKFAKEVNERTGQCFDDLLMAMLDLVLALPTEMHDLTLQVPALKQALQQGVTFPYIADKALCCLEKWIEDKETCRCLQNYLFEILPHLEPFFGLLDNREVSRKAVVSMDKKTSSYKYKMKQKTAHTVLKHSAGPSTKDSKDLAIRAVKLLGKLGTDEQWLAKSAEDDAFDDHGMDLNQGLLQLKKVHFGDTGREGGVVPSENMFILDGLLPRVMALAEGSPDRQTKVASCELLHAFVTSAVGFHAETGGDRSAQSHFGQLFASTFSCVFRLAVDGDPVSNQLFHPLIMQLIHWFVTKTEFARISDTLLSAILSGLESDDNGKLREASSQFLAEFVHWTLKGITNPEEMENATTVKHLLSRIYGLLNHPSAPKRLGGYLAVKQVADILKQNRANHAQIIDQFLLELLHNCILSLRLCAQDHPSMGTEKTAVAALKMLEKVSHQRKQGGDTRQFFDIFVEKRKGSRRPRRMHEDLVHFAKWVLSEIASHHRPARRYCMDLLPQLCRVLEGEGGPKRWVQSQFRGDAGVLLIASRFEDRLMHADKMDVLRALTGQYARMETTLDVYHWLLRGDYVRPSDLFAVDRNPSELASCVETFISNSEQGMPRLRQATTPSEERNHAIQRSKCIYALAKLVHLMLDSYSSTPDEIRKVPRQFVSRGMFRMLVLCILAPGSKLGLDSISDPIVDVEIPEVCKRLFQTMRTKQDCNHLQGEMQAVLAELFEELPHLGLSDPEQTLTELGRDGFAMMLRGHLHLVGALDAGCWPKRDSSMPGTPKSFFETWILDWVWEKHYRAKGVLEPSMKVLATSLLDLSLLHLQDPREVWKLFSPLKEDSSWQNGRHWSFYIEFREHLDLYLSTHTQQLLSGMVLPHVGRPGREYCALLLQNVIDSQCRELSKVLVNSGVATGAGRVARKVVDVCLSDDHRTQDWIQKLVDADHLKTALDLLGSLMLLIKRQEETESVTDVTDGTGIHQRMYTALMRVLEKETAAVKSGAVASKPLDVLVRVLEILPPFLARADAVQATELVQKVDEAVDQCLPSHNAAKLTMEQRGRLTPLFRALLRLISTSESPKVLPLVRNYMLKESLGLRPYLLETMPAINDALDEYILLMPEDKARQTALDILKASQQVSESQPNILRVERSVVENVCCRLLRRLTVDSVVAFFIECLNCTDALNALTLGGAGRKNRSEKQQSQGSLAETNQLICMMQVLDAIYTVADYEVIKDRVHKQGTALTSLDDIKDEIKDNVTKYFLVRLGKLRKLAPPILDSAGGAAMCEHGHRRAECELCNPELELYTQVVRQAMRCYTTVICCTQSELKAFKHIFSMTPKEWLNVVGTKEISLQAREARVEVLPDRLAALHRKHRQRTMRVQGKSQSLASSQVMSSQAGSLSLDLTLMPRSLLGEAPSTGYDTLGVMPGDRISDDVKLSEDDMNRNEAMLSLVKSLFTIQEKFYPQNTPRNEMPDWMQNLYRTLSDKDTKDNVKFFLVKIIVNYQQNLKRMSDAGRPMPDIFQPFADSFFEIFFWSPQPDVLPTGLASQTGAPTGLASQLCKRGAQESENVKGVEKLELAQKSFTLLLKDICELWGSWISPPPAHSSLALPPSTGFNITMAQARHGWDFIANVVFIIFSESSQEVSDTLFHLNVLIRAWRPKATGPEIEMCLSRVYNMYLKSHYSEWIKAKAEGQDKARIKTLHIAVQTGLSLLKHFFELELSPSLAEDRSPESTARISQNMLTKIFKVIMPMMEPNQHKNKENRKYNVFFKHAASISGQVLQCLWNLPDAKQPLEDGEETLLQRVKDIQTTSQPDQLVTALDGICSTYKRAGKLLYELALQHPNMHGELLYSVQRVHIAYTACLIDDKEAAMDEEGKDIIDKKGRDLVTSLMKSLSMWILKPDEQAQQLTLQLLTGRSASIDPTSPVSMGSSCSKGLLEFIDEPLFVNDTNPKGVGDGEGKERGTGLMACIREIWTGLTANTCKSRLRQAFYFLLQDICDQKCFWGDEILHELRAILVVGLTDDDDGVRQSVFNWWNWKGLSKDPNKRLAEVFCMQPPPPRHVDEKWLGNSVRLLLQLCRDSSSSKEKLFEKDLAYTKKINFSKREISTASTVGGASLPMATPMFASSLPFSQQGGSQSMSLYGATGGGSQTMRMRSLALGDGIMATQEDWDGGRATMSLDTANAVDNYFGAQTQQAEPAMLFVPRKKHAVPGLANDSGGGARARKRGLFAMPRPKAAISSASSHDAKSKEIARRREQQKETAERVKMTREKRVAIARAYRFGEIPDIQIQLDDILKPLQELAMRDSVIARLTLNVLFQAVRSAQTENRDQQAQKVKTENKEKIKSEMQKMLSKGLSSDLIGAILQMARTAELSISANYVSENCRRVKAFYEGIKALEHRASGDSDAVIPKAVPRRKRSASNAQLQVHVKKESFDDPPKKELRNNEEDEWKQLSRLYMELEETDIVRGLYDKFSKMADTKQALVHELEGRYREAMNIYLKLLTERDDDAMDAAIASELEQDLWEDGYEECLKKTHSWDELQSWYTEKAGGDDSFDDEIWKRDHRRLLHLHISQLVSRCSVTPPKRNGQSSLEWREFTQLVERVWIDPDGSFTDRKSILEQEFEHETALGLIVAEKPSRVPAKELINGALNRFLSDWASSSETGQVARRSKIRELQKVVELLEYIETGDDLEKQRRLMRYWESRLPRKAQMGDVESWDTILLSRLALLQRISSDERLRDDAQPTLRATYLAMSALARRRGNYDVADSMHRLFVDSASPEMSSCNLVSQLDGRSNALKIALAKARDGKDEISEDSLAEIDDSGNVLMLNEIKKGDRHSQDAYKKFLALSGEVCSVAGRSRQARQKFEAALQLQDCSAQHDDVLDLRSRQRKDAKIHFAFARFCDAQLRQGHLGMQEAPEYAQKCVENMLLAIEKGSTAAQEYFPRTLELLQESQSGDSIWRKWEQGCGRVPPAALIKWLPQLISHFKRCTDPSAAACTKNVLMHLNESYPQAVYMAVRVMKQEVRSLWEQLERGEQNNELERFCCALRHLQYPQLQLKDLRNVTKMGSQEIAAVWIELVEDFGAETQDSDFGRFRKTVNSKLARLRVKLRGPPPDNVQEILKELHTAAVPPLGDPGETPLANFSKVLHNFEGSISDSGAVCVPGQHLAPSPVRCEDEAAKIVSYLPTVRVMNSKTRPIRLIMRGSDGREYWWLVKGGEDLRQDERLQQLFASINQLLAADVKCSQRRLRLATFSVIPVSKRTGILEWVQDTQPLADLWQMPQDLKFKTKYETVHQQHCGCSQKPCGCWQKYKNSFNQGGSDKYDKNFQNMIDEIPADLMKRALFAKQESAHAQFLLRSSFATSLAAMNSSHYILGIGDRHDGNTLVTKRGQCVGIDFGFAFGKGVWEQPVPELVPFRLTRQMLGVLAPLDSEALLKRSMTCAISALRANKQLLLQNLKIFLDDPTMDWILDTKARQGENGKAEHVEGRTDCFDGGFLKRRMAVLNAKLDGKHPADVMLDEMNDNQWTHIKKNMRGVKAILDRVRGSNIQDTSTAHTQASNCNLSASDQVPSYTQPLSHVSLLLPPFLIPSSLMHVQVEALVQLATHPATLSRIWSGWGPWK